MKRGRTLPRPSLLFYHPLRKEQAHGTDHLESARSGPPGPDGVPHMTLTFDVERPISIAALERAMEADQDIFLVTQREIGVNAPEERTCTPLARSPTSRRSCGWASPLSG